MKHRYQHLVLTKNRKQKVFELRTCKDVWNTLTKKKGKQVKVITKALKKTQRSRTKNKHKSIEGMRRRSFPERSAKANADLSKSSSFGALI